jgi:hypothetical protein
VNEREQQIAALHEEYVRLTGIRITLPGREWSWFEWLKRGLGPAELRLLIAEKRRRIRAGELTAASLAFRNLVGNVDYAEEDIAELRARARTRPLDPNKASLLRQTGRSDVPRSALPAPRSTAQIVSQLTSDPAAAARALAEFKALKDRL